MSQEEIAGYSHILCCPACSQSLVLADKNLRCFHCSREFAIADEIPLLGYADAAEMPHNDETQIISPFYEAHPSPHYRASEDLASLIDKAREGSLACLLDEQIPFGTRILDCGCGIGKLSNFLGIAHRTVFGVDLSMNALRTARQFRQKHDLRRVHFLQMNPFFPVFKPQSFDVIIFNSILQSIGDPSLCVQVLSRLVKPGGYIVFGLYHLYSRIWTIPMKVLFRFRKLMRGIFTCGICKWQPRGNAEDAWFADQYTNPHENRFALSTVVQWMDPNGLRLVKTIPIGRAFAAIKAHESLFESETAESSFKHNVTDWGMLFSGIKGKGFFVAIARKL